MRLSETQIVVQSKQRPPSSATFTANAISPGPTETGLFLEGKTPEQLQPFGQMPSFGRIDQPKEIAEVVAFLASDASSWISDQNICVNGGLV